MIDFVDPDWFWKQRADREAKQEAAKAARAAERQPLPRKREACRACHPRRGWVLVDHIAKQCPACGGVGTVEAAI